MKKLRIFVTGGAGYLGSHFIKNCYESEHRTFDPEILAYDDLSRGLESNILYGDLCVGALDDRTLLQRTLAQFKPDVVVHFAAYIQVGESEERPWVYYKNNTENTLSLFRLLEAENIKRLVFSSTAAVYGSQGHDHTPVTEDMPFSPASVYGKSKAIADTILEESKLQLPFHFITFRYFNVCGADPQARIGQNPKEATHLITKALEVALGRMDVLPIYGDDYNTPDGTCIRDYIHVEDLVNTHILGVEALVASPLSRIFNVGTGTGCSVKEIIQEVNRVVGKEISVKVFPRRAGDVDFLVANATKLEKDLGWVRRFTLREMIEHAYNFQKKVS